MTDVPCPYHVEPTPKQADTQPTWSIDLALVAAEALENSGRRLLAQAEAIRAGINAKVNRR